MRVVHIIPSTFEYFDDIRSRAFGILNYQHEHGIEVEAITLQYDNPSRSVRREARESAPSVHSYQGHITISDAFSQLDEFDLVHLHTPFFGAGRRMLRWAKSRQKPFVITYYRPVIFSDVFSAFVKIYNQYYLPKLFKTADSVVDLRGEKELSISDIAENLIVLYNDLAG